MADYKAIKGWTIQTVSSDPSNLIAGQVWYNSTLGKLKGAKLAAGAWASSPAVNTGRHGQGSAGQTTEACLIAGGIGGQQLNEVWNGSSWTEAGDFNTKHHYTGGFGTSTAAIMAGGVQAGLPDPNHVTKTEEWDNSSWTEVGDLNTTTIQHIGAGVSSTSGIVVGGGGWASSPLDTIHTKTESWNGSSWTEIGELNTGKNASGGDGIATAAIIAGGGPPSSHTATCETFDGSSWTEVSDLNTGRFAPNLSGTTTSAVLFGGSGPHAITEQWDGSSWTETADLSTGRQHAGSSGESSGGALCISGYSTANVTNVEEWTGPAAAASNWDST